MAVGSRSLRATRSPLLIVLTSLLALSAWAFVPHHDREPVDTYLFPVGFSGEQSRDVVAVAGDESWQMIVVRLRTVRNWHRVAELFGVPVPHTWYGSQSEQRLTGRESRRRHVGAAWVAAHRTVGLHVEVRRAAFVDSFDAPLDVWTLIEAVDGTAGDVPAALHEASQRDLPVLLQVRSATGVRDHVVVGAADAAVLAGQVVAWDVPLSSPPEPFIPNNVRGSSLSLSVALAFVDQLVDGSLTDGAVVATSGVVHPDGKVSSVGLLDEKVAAAVAADVDVVFYPAKNHVAAHVLDAAAAVSIPVVAVETLSDAVQFLCDRHTEALCAAFAASSRTSPR